ncbi:macro domain-containing protein [Olsenella profusa]|uniref:macro domain-containing protein n=1 Tax=Olsenella profusa TaxID=138595 RepID=UPI0018DCAFBE
MRPVPSRTGVSRTFTHVQLASCHSSCLVLAKNYSLSSIVLCCIGTGVFGFPQKEERKSLSGQFANGLTTQARR